MVDGYEQHLGQGNAAAIQDLILWSEQIAGLETQKKFLHFVSKCFAKRFVNYYQTPSLVYMEPQVRNLNWEICSICK
jgi:DNA polymerase-3 subunit delta'